MTCRLIIHDAGPSVTLQDLGRTGWIAQGLSRGGAMDRLALHEAAALLARPVSAAIEMIGLGGSFETTQDTRIALTGAVMQARIGDDPIAWNASHLLPAGTRLTIGGAIHGTTGYLSFGGAFDIPPVMGSLSTHLPAGIGTALTPGLDLTLHADSGTRTGSHLPPTDRLTGGKIHIVASHQTHLFGPETVARFTATPLTRDARANRQGIRLNPDGAGYAAQGGLTVVSEIITPGDIQVTGDGAPYVLMCDSQTTGGYPRIATVIPSDLPRIAQAPLGAPIDMVLLERADAVALERKAAAHLKALPALCQPLIRDPATMQDLLSFNLISGAIDAKTNPYQGDMP